MERKLDKLRRAMNSGDWRRALSIAAVRWLSRIWNVRHRYRWQAVLDGKVRAGFVLAGDVEDAKTQVRAVR